MIRFEIEYWIIASLALAREQDYNYIENFSQVKADVDFLHKMFQT